jgi:hypothetical protein
LSNFVDVCNSWSYQYCENYRTLVNGQPISGHKWSNIIGIFSLRDGDVRVLSMTLHQLTTGCRSLIFTLNFNIYIDKKVARLTLLRTSKLLHLLEVVQHFIRQHFSLLSQLWEFITEQKKLLLLKLRVCGNSKLLFST